MAVTSETPGMPGVSGELNMYGVPTRPAAAKEPGLVPWRSLDGLSPSGGSVYERSIVLVGLRHVQFSLCGESGGRAIGRLVHSLPYAGIIRIRY